MPRAGDRPARYPPLHSFDPLRPSAPSGGVRCSTRRTKGALRVTLPPTLPSPFLAPVAPSWLRWRGVPPFRARAAACACARTIGATLSLQLLVRPFEPPAPSPPPPLDPLPHRNHGPLATIQ